jgi:cell division protein FtsB
VADERANATATKNTQPKTKASRSAKAPAKPVTRKPSGVARNAGHPSASRRSTGPQRSVSTVAKAQTPRSTGVVTGARKSSATKNRQQAAKTSARVSAARERFDWVASTAREQAAALQVITVRMLILGAVGLLSVVLLLPTLRATVDQKAQLGAMQHRLETQQGEVERLSAELDRWSDPAFIEHQARSRLGYAKPGDHVWRTVGGETLVQGPRLLDTGSLDVGEVAVADDVPWFKILADSLRVADERVDDDDNSDG